MSEPVLELKDLAISFRTPKGEVEAVRGVDLSVNAGEILCLVGESGCGKTVLCQSVMHLLPDYAYVKRGSMSVCGAEITHFTERQMRHVRGRSCSMVFQDPLTTLNPTIPIGKQIMEAIRKQEKVSREAAANRALELLERQTAFPCSRISSPAGCASGACSPSPSRPIRSCCSRTRRPRRWM